MAKKSTVDPRRRAYVFGIAAAVPGLLTGCLAGGSDEASAGAPSSSTSTGVISAAPPASVSNMSESAAASAQTAPFMIAATGARFATMATALAAAVSGDTIKVKASGTPYVVTTSGGFDPRGTINQTNLTIEWETPGLAPIFDLSGLPNYPGLFTMGAACANLTIRGIKAIGSQRAYAGSSGGNAYISVEAGYPYSSISAAYTLNLEYCGMYKWSNGVFTGPNNNGTINIRYCVVENCQGGDGLSHGSYVSTINTLNVVGSVFRTTSGGITDSGSGALLKTRAKHNNIIASIFDGVGGCNRSLELDNGGIAVVDGNYFFRAADPTNPNQVIRYGAAQRDAAGSNFARDGRTHSFTFRQNTVKNGDGLDSNTVQIDAGIVDDLGNPTVVARQVKDNIVAGVNANSLIALSAVASDNREVTLAQLTAAGRLTITPIAGSSNSAPLQFNGDFAVPMVRLDANMGAFGS